MSFKISTLDNGLAIATEHDPDSGGFVMDWLMRMGARHEKVDGVTHYSEHMTMFGTTGPSGRELAARFDEICNDMNFVTSKSAMRGYAHSLPEHAEEIITAMGRALTRPSWTPAIFERERNRILTEYEMDQKNSSKLAYMAGMGISYPDHPVGRRVIGSPESIISMREEDVLACMRESFQAKKMAFFFSGPLKHKELTRIANKAFRALPPGNPVPRQEAPRFLSMQKVTVHLPGAAQSISLIYEGMRAGHAHENANAVMTSLYSDRLGNAWRQAGMYVESYAYTSTYPDYGQNVVFLNTSPEKAREHISLARDLAERPEEWLTQDNLDRFLGRKKMRIAFSNSDPRNRNSGRAGFYEMTGRISSLKKIKKHYERNISHASLMQAYDMWKRDEFNLVACGPMPAENVPSPQEAVAAQPFSRPKACS